MSQKSALVLTDAEWLSLERVARQYLSGEQDWAETDEDEEALEVRDALCLCRRIVDLGCSQ